MSSSATAAATGLRERSKSRRRSQILDATRLLLREHEAKDVSVDEIAELAEVAPATVYNLVGSRNAIWVALIDDVLDDLDEELARLAEQDPIAVAAAVITISVGLFAADAKVHRQALLHMHAPAGGENQLQHNPVDLQITAMQDAIDAGTLDDRLSADQLGRQVFASYNGALYFWSLGLLSKKEFERLALHGLYTVLAAAATDETRPGFLRELRRLAS